MTDYSAVLDANVLYPPRFIGSGWTRCFATSCVVIDKFPSIAKPEGRFPGYS